MKTKCVVITNKNSWISEVIIDKLYSSEFIDLQSVVFFDAKGNLKLIRKRISQYGLRKFSQKIFFIIRNIISGIFRSKKGTNKKFVLSFQTVKRYNINYHISANLNSKKTIDYLDSINPEIVLVVSCSQIFSREFLSKKKRKYINFHDSLLPLHKGASPSFWVLYNQEKVTGYTIHQILPKIDSGKILYQEEVSTESIKKEEDLIIRIVNTAAIEIDRVVEKINKSEDIDFIKSTSKESYEKIPTHIERKELRKILNKDV